LGEALKHVYRENADYDRIVVITDEQSHDKVQAPTKGKGYVVNVASNKNGIGYGSWVHIDGFSSHILDWIREDEQIIG
jgi:hypothetical protein